MTESSNNFQAVILRQHGRDVLRNLRAAENTAVKIAKWTNHRIFNITCIRADIIPNSLKLGSVVRGTNAAIVLRKAEKRLLDIRVRQCSFTIAKLEEAYAKREAIVVSGIPAQNSTARNDVTEFLGRARSLAFEEVKTKHRERFANIVATKRSREHQRSDDAGKIDKSSWVVNKSNKTLTTDEHSVLEKGLNFAVTPGISR